ncbi:choice-of-anchor L domain-containing protein [Jiangella mangrovi]|uniref:Uncharacterized protein n=1 Tax=Jiangella mangrovi TaxID=1524084 RepID=A0A7W9GTU7_9ACTN|nr:hypothetical protein [Jiangella mangrovi]
MRSLSSVHRTSALVAGGLLILATAGAPAALAADEPAERTFTQSLAPKGEGVGDQTVVDLDTGDLTVEEIVQTLVGDGVTVDNVAYTGSPVSAGLAGGFDDVFGVAGGVLLSSGAVGGERSSVLGPNVADDMTTEVATPGDTDLSELSELRDQRRRGARVRLRPRDRPDPLRLHLRLRGVQRVGRLGVQRRLRLLRQR